ncbi:uncharacterized protein [Solanum tuberosum]|uniref:uncharacterized protein n=1 Tax=Solanum tuberosum TaxID=4113 RepID=UPI00073A2545|nr:PREDICTED: uncharacterized protein LOC107061662 [Solanum tuberosum]
MVWNEAAIAKYVWNIANKADNLWVKWVNHVYLKGEDWWNYRPSHDSCWYWKKICNVKNKFADGFRGNRWLRPIGIYTIKSGYQWKQNEGQQRDWWRAVWNRTNVPKHSFIFWLAIRCRLLTRERLVQMGIGQDITCPLCGSYPETNAHLFFECEFSKACLEDILN